MINSHTSQNDTRNLTSDTPTILNSSIEIGTKKGINGKSPMRESEYPALLKPDDRLKKILPKRIKEMGRDFTEEEIDQMMTEMQTNADIDRLSTKTIKAVKKKRKKQPTTQSPAIVQKEKDPRKIKYSKPKSIKEQKTNKKIHWLKY